MHQFIDPLLELLGWPTHDPNRYKYELSTEAGWPDMVLFPEQGGTKLRDELDALVAHLYGLSRDDLVHFLGTFPLVFPDTAEGQARKETLLTVYDRFADVISG